jgi:hypothetical protein
VQNFVALCGDRKAAVEEVTLTGMIHMCSVLYYMLLLQQMIHILQDELGGGESAGNIPEPF